jgi:putative membrane protein
MHALIPLLADSNGWHHDHWWIVFPILWTALLVSVIVFFARRSRPAHDGGDPAARILGERFARGEIDAEEYRRRLEQLRTP